MTSKGFIKSVLSNRRRIVRLADSGVLRQGNVSQDSVLIRREEMYNIRAKSFYNSKLWQTTRKQVLNRDHYTCCHCPMRAEEVHHIIPLDQSNIGDYSIVFNPDNLMSLCKSCHSKITNGFKGDVADEYIFDDDGNIIPSPHAKQ